MRRLLLALLLALTLPASARAAAGVSTGPLEVGPLLVRDGAIWIERDGTRTASVMGGRPDGRVRRLRRTYAGGLSSNGDVATFTIDSELWTATVGGGLRRVEGLPEECSPTNAELDGAVMVVACGGYENYSVVVRRAGAPDKTFEAGGSGVAVAGRYAAWAARGRSGTVVLYDAVAGREVLRARGDGRETYPLTLQPDGTMLIGLGGAFEDTSIGWLSRAEPRLHLLDVPPGGVRGFARNRVLSLVDDRESHAVSVSTGAELVGIDGSRRTVASTLGTGRIVGGAYDGERIALARATCNGSRILFRSAAAPALTVPAPRLCTMIAASPPSLEFSTRDRPRIEVRIRCLERTLRVCGDLVVRTPGGERLSSESYVPGFDGGYNVYLTDRAVRLIAREGSMPLRLEMLGRDSRRPLQNPIGTTLRVAPEELLRLKRCLRARRFPAQSECPE